MFIEQKTLREIQPIKSFSFDCPCMPSCMLLLCCLSNPISSSPIIQINYMLCFTVCTLSCYALCMPSGGPLNSKLALGPSKAMKSLKHLLHPAHFLYVQNFPTSTEFYWKINAFQCFQGEWIFEGCKIITTLRWVFHWMRGGWRESKQCVTRFDIGDIQHCQESYLKRSVQHPKRLRPTSKLPSTGR